MNWKILTEALVTSLKVFVCTCLRRLKKSTRSQGEGSRCPVLTQNWHQSSPGTTSHFTQLSCWEGLFWAGWIQSAPNSFEAQFNILQSTPLACNLILWGFPLKPCTLFLMSLLWYRARRSELPPFDHPNDIYWRSQIMVLSLCSVRSITERSLYRVYNYKYFQLEVGNHFRCS
jgi:hypothetical protein